MLRALLCRSTMQIRTIAVFIFIACVFGAIPYSTEAQTQAEIEGQIQILFSQIAELEAVLTSLQGSATLLPATTTSAPLGAGCPVLARVLAREAQGEDVRSLQEFLIREGNLAAGNATGYFGPLTEAAVRAWQAEQAIVSSGDAATTGFGVVGPKTRAAIQAACSIGGSSTPTQNQAPEAQVPSAAAIAIPPSITVSAPREGSIAASGGTLRIAWQSTNAPVNARVTLTLVGASGERVRTIASGLISSGEYTWQVPPQSAGECAPGEDVFVCISRIAECGGNNLCTLKAGMYKIEAALSIVTRATSGTFQVGGSSSSNDSLFDSLFNIVQQSTSSLFNLPSLSGTNTSTTTTGTGIAAPGSCVHEGQTYPSGTTLSAACFSGNCPSYAGGTGYITGLCTNGEWCIPHTAYCSLSLSTINVSAYEGNNSDPGSSVYSISCPQEGYRAYLACPSGGCVTGWNTCRNGAWVRDTEQQVVQVGTQGPCSTGHLWCAIDTFGAYGCVPTAACVSGSAASTSQ